MIITQTKTQIIPISNAPQFVNVTVYSIKDDFDKETGLSTTTLQSYKAVLNMAFISRLMPKTLEVGTKQFTRDSKNWVQKKLGNNNTEWFLTQGTKFKVKAKKKVLQVSKAHSDLHIGYIEYITIDKA